MSKKYVMKPCEVLVEEPPEMMKKAYIKMHGFSKEQVERMKMVVFHNGFKTMWDEGLINNFLLEAPGNEYHA